MLNAINSISFTGKFRFGGYSKHVPVCRNYKEFEFQPELQSKNSIIEFFKALGRTFKEIVECSCPNEEFIEKENVVSKTFKA